MPNFENNYGLSGKTFLKFLKKPSFFQNNYKIIEDMEKLLKNKKLGFFTKNFCFFFIVIADNSQSSN